MFTTAVAYGYIGRLSCLGDEEKSCSTSSSLSPPDCIPACPDSSGGRCCDRHSNRGWRYLFFTLGAVSLTIFIARFVFFTFHESPKWLLSMKKDHLAVNTLRYIADFNKNPTNLTLQRLHDLDRIEASETQIGPEEVMVPPNDTEKKGWKGLLRRLRPRKRDIPWERFGPCREGLQYVGSGLWKWGADFVSLWTGWRNAHLILVIFFMYAFDFWGFSIVGESCMFIMDSAGS